jgi:hypothetical protein
MPSKRHPSASSRAFSCFGGTFHADGVSDFIVSELKYHSTSELVENHLLSFECFFYCSELSPVGGENVNGTIPSPHPGFHLWEDSFS